MIELGPAPAQPTAEDLLHALGPELKSVIERETESDAEPEKVWQYSNARRNYLMFRGLQFLAPVNRNGYTDYAPVGNGYGAMGANNGQSQEPCYDYTRNIIRGYGNKFIAVLGQRSPNVRAMANNPESRSSVEAARQADQCNAILNSWWDVDQKNVEAATWVWTTGPAYIYTPWNADGDMYGYREEPKYRTEQRPMGEPFYRCFQCGAQSPTEGPCPQCGYQLGPETRVDPEMADVPVLDGVARYPNGRVECYVLDCTTVSTPFYAKSDLKYCPWLRYDVEENRAYLISRYPQLRDKPDDFGSVGTPSDQGRQTRDAMISPSGSPLRGRAGSRWFFSRVWLQSKMYNTIRKQELRSLLEQNFPSGVKISMVQGEIVQLEDERLDRVWSAIQPSAAANLNADPVVQDLISAQLLVNHTLNIGAQTIEGGNALTFADPRIINFQHWREQSSKPNVVIPTLPAVGSSLAESFYQTQPSRFSDQMEPWVASVEAGAVQDVGTQPQIFGGGNASTAREAEINKNAAMMQLGICWMYFRKGWERAKRNGVYQLIQYGPQMVQEGRNVADLAKVADDTWHFEADEAIPCTWGQMRDLVMFMMQQPAPVLEMFGFNRPENIERNKSLLGFTGYYTPGLDDTDKTYAAIQKLLEEQPIVRQNPDGSTDVQPSISADDFEDNAQLVVQIIQGWAQSPAGRSIRDDNPAGYSNVIAYGRQYQKLLNPPPPAPPPVQPKVSVSVSSKDLAPEQTQAILGDVNLQVPPSPPPMAPPAGAMPPAPQPQPAAPTSA